MDDISTPLLAVLAKVRSEGRRALDIAADFQQQADEIIYRMLTDDDTPPMREIMAASGYESRQGVYDAKARHEARLTDEA